MSTILDIKNLHVKFKGSNKNYFHAIKGVDLKVEKNETLGIVGESGSGKSVTSTSIIGLLPDNAEVKGDKMIFQDKNLLNLSNKEYQKLRGNEISMIFQDPMTSLNPVYTIGNQIMEVILTHQDVSKKEARQLALDMLEKVGIKDPEKRMDMYPHEFSGGMRQRVMIAIALVCQPKLLIADEPTTALDVTIQAQILGLLKELQKDMGTSIIMITHDLGVIWEMCDKVAVMFKGHVVEYGTVYQIYDNPTHPYTIGLLKSQVNESTINQDRLQTIHYGAYLQDMEQTTALNMFEVEPGHFVAEFTKEEGIVIG